MLTELLEGLTRMHGGKINAKNSVGVVACQACGLKKEAGWLTQSRNYLKEAMPEWTAVIVGASEASCFVAVSATLETTPPVE